MSLFVFWIQSHIYDGDVNFPGAMSLFCTVLCTLFSCYILNYADVHTTAESPTMQISPRNIKLKIYSFATPFAGSR